MLEIGSLVDGKYKILNKVGQGGMSVVYLAMNEKANKQWAVKEVRKDGIKDFEVVKQGLVAETDILKKLNHPSLPSIIDVIDTEDSFIIIMDYIQGNSLNKALDEYGAQPQEDVIEWAKQLCDVLGYLHTREPAIIYRDMKPANIMLKPDGTVTLIDFGTAREFKEKNLADTTCLGTVGYAAPEQFGGMGQTDGRTDIYCLGATLYHLVTGMNPCEPPYEIKPIRDVNPMLSSGFEKIILKCTQRDPNDRYQSAAELMYALEHYEEIDDVYRKKQTGKLWAFLSCAIMTLLFVIVSIWGYVSAEQTRGENFEYLLASAKTADDYFDAMLADPTRYEAYLGKDDYKGLVAFVLEDDVLSSEENEIFQTLRVGLNQTGSRGYKTTVNALEELRKADPEHYEEICYEIGEAYLFYYDIGVERNKYSAAASWFQHATDNYPVAQMYCDISECLENIDKYARSDQFAKLYEEYTNLWTRVRKLQEDAENFDDDLKLRVWNEIVNMILNNSQEFCEVASKEEVLSFLDKLDAEKDMITNTFLQEEIERIDMNIDVAKSKVSTVRVNVGGETQ